MTAGRAAWRAYGVALAASGAALVATTFASALLEGAPFVLPLAAVMIASWYGGLVPGVVNALQHSGSQDVCVDATTADGYVVIRVIDHGRGIPEDEQARLFEKFATVRRSPASDPIADTGLGLPFCRLAVEHMAGCIALKSTPGAGSVFEVTLPIHAART